MKEITSNKKSAILKAALELFTEKGIKDTPMSQIAKRADAGMGTIYNYFPSKEVLIGSLYEEIHSRIIHYLQEYSVKVSAPRDNFLQHVCSLIRYLIKHPAELSLIEQYENHPQSFSDESSPDGKGYDVFFLNAFEEGLLKRFPIQTLVDIVIGMILLLTKLYIKNSFKVTAEETSIAEMAEIIWDAIKV